MFILLNKKIHFYFLFFIILLQDRLKPVPFLTLGADENALYHVSTTILIILM